jgi:hypothetical protein
MLAKQKQAIEAYQRVQDFLKEHPLPESPGYRIQKQALDDVVATLNEHTTSQVAGRRLRSAEVRREDGLIKMLRELHLAPIAKIARATLDDAPGIEKALKMPDYYLAPLQLLAEARAMRNEAARYEQHFVESGRPVDFLAQLDGAIDALSQSMTNKDSSLGRQVGGTAGIALEIKRGRRVVDLLDTIVTTTFYDDENVRAKWRSAKRVRAIPGGGNSIIATSDEGPIALVAA